MQVIEQHPFKSLRDLSHRLYPAKLRLIGLVAAIAGLQRDLARPGVAVEFFHDNVPAVTAKLQPAPTGAKSTFASAACGRLRRDADATVALMRDHLRRTVDALLAAGFGREPVQARRRAVQRR